VKLSARNRIPATVTAITAGEATANIELDACGAPPARYQSASASLQQAIRKARHRWTLTR